MAEKNLTFMFITSFGEFGYDSSGAIPAADLALNDVNENSSMLPGYRLVYDKPRNSQVSADRPFNFGSIIAIHMHGLAKLANGYNLFYLGYYIISARSIAILCHCSVYNLPLKLTETFGETSGSAIYSCRHVY